MNLLDKDQVIYTLRITSGHATNGDRPTLYAITSPTLEGVIDGVNRFYEELKFEEEQSNGE